MHEFRCERERERGGGRGEAKGRRLPVRGDHLRYRRTCATVLRFLRLYFGCKNAERDVSSFSPDPIQTMLFSLQRETDATPPPRLWPLTALQFVRIPTFLLLPLPPPLLSFRSRSLSLSLSSLISPVSSRIPLLARSLTRRRILSHLEPFTRRMSLTHRTGALRARLGIRQIRSDDLRPILATTTNSLSLNGTKRRSFFWIESKIYTQIDLETTRRRNVLLDRERVSSHLDPSYGMEKWISKEGVKGREKSTPWERIERREKTRESGRMGRSSGRLEGEAEKI